MDDFEKLDVIISAFDAFQSISNPWYNGHQKRCAATCVRFLEYLNNNVYSMNMTEEFIKQVSYAAHCHDIGKSIVPESILNKPGRLTESEWDTIRKHSVHGYDIIESVGLSDKTIPLIVKYVHESWDGSGYPDGIRELTIPLGSRILNIVDRLDAMTNNRVYRKVFSVKDALIEMDSEVGKKFDPQLYAEFRKMMEG